eukprot:801578-Amorphochlora_amoeboformis.AAC.1
MKLQNTLNECPLHLRRKLLRSSGIPDGAMFYINIYICLYTFIHTSLGPPPSPPRLNPNPPPYSPPSLPPNLRQHSLQSLSKWPHVFVLTTPKAHFRGNYRKCEEGHRGGDNSRGQRASGLEKNSLC